MNSVDTYYTHVLINFLVFSNEFHSSLILVDLPTQREQFSFLLIAQLLVKSHLKQLIFVFVNNIAKPKERNKTIACPITVECRQKSMKFA